MTIGDVHVTRFKDGHYHLRNETTCESMSVMGSKVETKFMELFNDLF